MTLTKLDTAATIKAYKKLVKDLQAENARLNSALEFIANHHADPGSALATVVKFVKLTLGADTAKR